MKLPTALFTLTFSVWALAAPIPTSTPVSQTSSRTTILRQSKVQHASKPPTEAHPDFQSAINNQRVQLPHNAASPDSWQTPHILSFISSLTRHPKTSTPFAESSIMGEETRANRGETDPQETIVELETKAERESWTYLPYLSSDGVLRFRRVRNAPDIVAVAMVLSALVTFSLWQLCSFFRRRYGQSLSRTGTSPDVNLDSSVRSYWGNSKKGAIRLQDGGKANLSRDLSVKCESLVPQHPPSMESTSGTLDENLDEKGRQI
ncbi:hypothetical protein F4779DRAFT_527571 [Xylariaceae sp. FL0662B]|nr:hypothetical protein F4779DRAFT_527571 [Xylariaceae sp. FL0662B]